MNTKRFLDLQSKHNIKSAVGGLFVEPKSNLFSMYAYITDSGSIEFCDLTDESQGSRQYTDLYNYTLAIKKALEV